MPLNSLYYSTDERKEIILKMDFLCHTLNRILRENFNVIQVFYPLFKERDSELLLQQTDSRSISFDSASRGSINTIMDNLSFWLTESLEKYKIKAKEGLMVCSSMIRRDIQENEYQALTSHKIIIEIRWERQEGITIQNPIIFHGKKLYKLLHQLSEEMAQAFDNKTKVIPKNSYYLSSQLLENEFPNLSFKQREKIFCEKYQSLIIENPGQKLYSGQFHRHENPILYNIRAQNLILLHDKINSQPVPVAKVSMRAEGSTLHTQITNFSLDQYLRSTFVQRLIKEQFPPSIQMEIDIPNLALVLLKKSHISEITPIDLPKNNKNKDIMRRLKTL